MAYTKHTWLQRLGVKLNRFKDQNNVQYEFTSDPESVSQAGTPFSAAWMNEIEDGIYNADRRVLVSKSITTTWAGSSAPYSQTISVTGLTTADILVVRPALTGTHATDINILAAWTQITRIKINSGSITVYSIADLATEIPIHLLIAFGGNTNGTDAYLCEQGKTFNGSHDKYLMNDGTTDYSMRLLATLTTSGNFVTSNYPSYNGLYAFVLIGGGGGGSGTNIAASQRGGGAGGLTSTGLVLKSGTYAFTIGSGGAAGDGGAGGAGGDTVFGAFDAGGGAGGTVGGVNNTLGGTGNVTGASGIYATGGVNALHPTYGYGGNGANPGQPGLKGALLVYGF